MDGFFSPIYAHLGIKIFGMYEMQSDCCCNLLSRILTRTLTCTYGEMQFLLKTNNVYLCSSLLAKYCFSLDYYYLCLFYNGHETCCRILIHSVRVMCAPIGVFDCQASFALPR